MDALQTNLLTTLAATDCCQRTETMDGRAYLVVPVVALRAGVLNNELVPAAEIGAYVGAWNDVPVPVQHPTKRGVHVSARTPDVLASAVIGRFYNAEFVEDRLRGELWIDLVKAQAVGGPAARTLAALQAGEHIEVSTGYYRDFEDSPGTWQGKEYAGIARNIRPDHLALLPDGRGACSWADGCGAPRVNEAEAAMVGEPTDTAGRAAPEAQADTGAIAMSEELVENMQPEPVVEQVTPAAPETVEVLQAHSPAPAAEPVAAVSAAEPTPEPADTELTALRAALATVGGVPGFLAAVAELRAHQEAERAALLAEVQANLAVAFEPAELTAMDTTTLRKLAQSLKPVNYAGRGGPQANVSTKEEVAAMPAFLLAPVN